jgi:hypothetical protein
MTGMTMSPQLRESPDTANFQALLMARFCATSGQQPRRISPKKYRIRNPTVTRAVLSRQVEPVVT